MVAVHLQVPELLHLPGRPADLQPVDFFGAIQAEVDQGGALGKKTVDRIEFARKRSLPNLQRDFGADAERVALFTSQRDF